MPLNYKPNAYKELYNSIGCYLQVFRLRHIRFKSPFSLVTIELTKTKEEKKKPVSFRSTQDTSVQNYIHRILLIYFLLTFCSFWLIVLI